MGRVAVIGDLAGHLAELVAELERLGARNGLLPDDLTVVQVGDLIHRGPDSDGVVRLVDHYLRTQPTQWFQLIGNHEAQYVHEAVFDWPEHISDDAAQLLLDWWVARVMTPAVAIRAGDENFLVTHAGLTAGYWTDALDRPDDAGLAAKALNSFVGRHEPVIFASGQMLGGGRPDFRAGPVWAAAATELVPSWFGTTMPFSQVHGHSMNVNWKRHELRCDDEIAAVLTLDDDAAHETVTLSGGRIVGIDPGHSRNPHHPWRAFVLDDAEVLPT